MTRFVAAPEGMPGLHFMDRHSTLSDMDIQALVDNELDWEQEKRVRSCIAADPGAKARYEMLRRQKMLLKEWWEMKRSH